MRLKAPKERDTQRLILDWLKAKGIFCWRQNTGGVFDPTSKRFRAFTGLKGVSDILGVLPESRTGRAGGRLLACEVKGPKGKLTAEQEAFLRTVESLGGLAIAAWSLADVESALRDAGYV